MGADALAACGLGLLWGYSVLATRGMIWAILAHACADFVYFSAQEQGAIYARAEDGPSPKTVWVAER